MSAISFWSRVEGQAEKVAIVATGPSCYGVDFNRIPRDVYVIAVKGAIEWLPRVDAWVTVDANDRVRERYMTTLRPGVKYYAAVPEDYGMPKARIVWHRKPAEKGIDWLRRISGGRDGVPGLTDDRSALHSGNSAYGALGIAWHLCARKIAIFGLDATQAQYGRGIGRPRFNLDHVPELFQTAVPQLSDRGVEVVLGSPGSRVRAFPRVTPNDALRWLND